MLHGKDSAEESSMLRIGERIFEIIDGCYLLGANVVRMRWIVLFGWCVRTLHTACRENG